LPLLDYKDEVDQNQNYVQPLAPPLGRPHAYNRNGRAAPPPQVRDYDHVPQLKLNIPPFEGRYIPDVYLTWELETEQHFTCLQYPEDRRVDAIDCEFTSFPFVWCSEHCRLYHDNIPTTWPSLKNAMRTHWVRSHELELSTHGKWKLTCDRSILHMHKRKRTTYVHGR
jgi:hypothetical protein